MKELFIVEGESAASSVRQAMHKPSQSVLACQGKLINVEKATSTKVLANQTCQKIFQSLGCGIQKDCNARNLLFTRVLILTGPGADGVHARLLLLRLFQCYLRPLINAGAISVILPPLFRLVETRTSNHQYAWDEQQRIQLLNNMANPDVCDITRFKGVAQFSETECRQLLLHSDTRKQIDLTSTEKSNAESIQY
jgi:DNA gyrase/topoisomerase IV subunit B